ncbi:hypothetical protein, partial [Enterobacter cloacae complex sp. 4DZ1-17B1]|uniref:hypothetical protein n=1 Tax=Enterobacter cloacae complex sp. 4DZ1-17B1 TaxID=2511991 RepID=UPI001CA5EA35
ARSISTFYINIENKEIEYGYVPRIETSEGIVTPTPLSLHLRLHPSVVVARGRLQKTELSGGPQKSARRAGW